MDPRDASASKNAKIIEIVLVLVQSHGIGWHQRGLRVVAVKLLMKEQTPSSVGVHLLQSLKKSQVELIKRSRDILDSGISRHFSFSTSPSTLISRSI